MDDRQAYDLAYLLCAVLFIWGLKRLSSPATAPLGNRIAAAGMALAIGVTLVDSGATIWAGSWPASSSARPSAATRRGRCG